MSVGSTAAYLDFMERSVSSAPDHGDWWASYDARDNELTRASRMGRYTQETGGSFTPPPVGTHVARCYSLIDIGTQHGEYQGQPTVRNQVIIGWELPNELMDDGRPFVVSKFYTNSLNEKAALRGDLESWRGRGFTQDELRRFDLMNILGAPCMVSVIEADNGKRKVAIVAALPKGTTCPDLVNTKFAFWLDEFDQAKFDKLPDGIKKLIEKSDEWKAMHKPAAEVAGANGAPPADFDDDIPF